MQLESLPCFPGTLKYTGTVPNVPPWFPCRVLWSQASWRGFDKPLGLRSQSDKIILFMASIFLRKNIVTIILCMIAKHMFLRTETFTLKCTGTVPHVPPRNPFRVEGSVTSSFPSSRADVTIRQDR